MPHGDDDGEAALVARLQAGDEAAFVSLVRRHHAAMTRFASAMVPNRAVAEEVVQDTWLAVVRGVERFEGRSSLRTWLYRILVNRARSTGAREHRSLPVDLTPAATVDPARFDAAGHWVEPPQPWTDDVVVERVAAAGMARRAMELLDALPPAQREVVLLRDVDGLAAAEVCDLLGLSEANQRVLLHRGRAGVRRLLEAELGEGG